jgi:energy-coupling factor transporter ATP-binding protein EcfA2
MKEELRNDQQEFADQDVQLDFNNELVTVEIIHCNEILPIIGQNGIIGYGYEGKNPFTNFICEFADSVYTENRSSSKRIFRGKIITNEEQFDVEIPAEVICNANELKKFLYTRCGSQIVIDGINMSKLTNVILKHNKDIPNLETKPLGWNEDLTKYYMPDHIVTSNEIIEVKTPILNGNTIKEYKVGVKLFSKEKFEELKTVLAEIISRDFVLQLCFIFSMLAIIYPFLRGHVKNRPFFYLIGPSGSGKTTFIRWMSKFFGEFNHLLSITSTATALSIIANAMKDITTPVDDLKQDNLTNEYAQRSFQMFFQTSADEHSRSRATTTLEKADEKPVLGVIASCGEDLIFTEASTLARGVIVRLETQLFTPEEMASVEQIASDFPGLTPRFIQHVLNSYTKENIRERYNMYVKEFRSYTDELELCGSNIERVHNNFSIVAVTASIFFEFMSAEIEEWQRELFFDNLKELMVQNYRLIEEYKPEVLFEKYLWELIENKNLVLRNIHSEFGDSRSAKDYIGEYLIVNNQITVVIKVSMALKEINNYLRSQGTIKISNSTLLSALNRAGKIADPIKDRYTFSNGHQTRGYLWLDEIPAEVIEKISGNRNVVQSKSNIPANVFSIKSKTRKNIDKRDFYTPNFLSDEVLEAN